METDGADVAPAPEPSPPSEPPSQARKSPVVAFVLAALGVLIVGVLGLLVLKANSDKSELQDRLDSSETEVAQLTSQVEAGAQRADDLEARLSDIEVELDAADVQLEDAAEVREGVVDFFAASLSLGAGLSAADSGCISEALADELGVAELLSATLALADVAAGSSDVGTDTLSFGLAVTAAAEECGLSLDDVPSDQGSSYGDDAALDALYDQCAAGAMVSCDQLYLESPLGSEYEAFAVTCGGLFDPDNTPVTCETAANAAPVISGSPLPQLAPDEDDPAIGLNAPMVTGFDFDGTEVEIGANGRATAIVFMAHWCSHCQAEIPRIQAWLDSGGGVTGVDIVGVVSSTSASRPNYPPSDWLEREGWTPPVIADGSDGAVMGAFGTGACPSWVFLNADGTVAARVVGALDTAALEAFLEMLAP